jgi:hypothetical protein
MLKRTLPSPDAEGEGGKPILPIVIVFHVEYNDPTHHRSYIIVNETGAILQEYQKLFVNFGQKTKLAYFCAFTLMMSLLVSYDQEGERDRWHQAIDKMYKKYYPIVTIECLKKMEADRLSWKRMNAKQFNRFTNNGRLPVRVIMCDTILHESEWKDEMGYQIDLK